MSILKIVLYPDAPLREEAAPFEEDDFGPKLEKLANDMLETMHRNDGVGLAGPQVGLARRIFVLQEPEGEPMALVNPEIYAQEGSESAEEGCLRLPDIFAPVSRAAWVRARARTPMGDPLDIEAEGLLARILQHETDHLGGVCFIDRLDVFTRQEKLDEWDVLREEFLNGRTRETGRRHAR